MKMMAPTRRTLFFSAIAALWCCYSITIAAAGRNGQMIQLTVGGIRLAEGIYVIDLNKDGNIGAELELAAPDAGGDGTFICVRRPELVEASAIVHLKRGLQTQPILNAVQRVEEKSLEVGEVGGGWFGDVGGGWFGPVGVRTENHYAVYLFQLKADGLAPEPPASLQSHFGAAFPVYLRLPWYHSPIKAITKTRIQWFVAPGVTPIFPPYLPYKLQDGDAVLNYNIHDFNGNGLVTLHFSCGGIPYSFYLMAAPKTCAAPQVYKLQDAVLNYNHNGNGNGLILEASAEPEADALVWPCFSGAAALELTAFLRKFRKVDTEAASSSTKTYQFYLMETLLHPMMFAAPQHAADVSQASGSTENDQRRSAPAYLSPVLSPAVADEAGTSASQPAAVEAGARASSSEEEDVEMAPPPGLPLLRRLEGQA